MIKLTLDYENDESPRVVYISDSFLTDEQMVVDFINSYLYDYFHDHIDEEDLPEPYRSLVENTELYYKLAATLQNYDLWEGWDAFDKKFDKFTKIEIIDPYDEFRTTEMF